MANKTLFNNRNSLNKNTKNVDTVNNSGGAAYSLEPELELAQLAMTGTFHGMFVSSGEDQLERILTLCYQTPIEFVAKLAVYSRQYGLMKDMPAVLAAWVAAKDTELFSIIFDRVIDSPKMLRNFVQVVRSGVTGRKSFGSKPKRLIQNYLNNLSDVALFNADVGNNPSLQDIIKMVHPAPKTKNRNALYGYLLGKKFNSEDLPQVVKDFELFSNTLDGALPNVSFQKLTSLPLTESQWKSVAVNATFNQLRQNLNSFQRHNVFSNDKLIAQLANTLSDASQISRYKVMPYSLFTTYLNTKDKIPTELTNALQLAAHEALNNIPYFDANVKICVDVSGSMDQPITGYNGSATSKTKCRDVAALLASALMKKCRKVEVLPFTNYVIDKSVCSLNPLDSIMTNSEKIASCPPGSTACSAPLKLLNKRKDKADLVVFISDNESWADVNGIFLNSYYKEDKTELMKEWNLFKKNNSKAKLVCIDIVPNTTSQAHDRDDILNIGGFSDNVFNVIESFQKYGNNNKIWLKDINQITL